MHARGVSHSSISYLRFNSRVLSARIASTMKSGFLNAHATNSFRGEILEELLRDRMQSGAQHLAASPNEL
jgi:hypothetical protein